MGDGQPLYRRGGDGRRCRAWRVNGVYLHRCPLGMALASEDDGKEKREEEESAKKSAKEMNKINPSRGDV